MRTIEVSVEVFARIWALREDGENSENEILRRILLADRPGVELPKVEESPSTGEAFPQAFRIYRHYKGRTYEASRRGAGWYFTADGKLYQTINRISGALGIKNENVWANWEYKDEKGRFQKIGQLRDKDQVRRRKVPVDLDIGGLEL